jgi:chemotaxis family two-component system response regulator Rcp1
MTRVLATSGSDAELLKRYQLRASGYITKPVDLEEFLNVVKSIDDFCLTRVKSLSESNK